MVCDIKKIYKNDTGSIGVDRICCLREATLYSKLVVVYYVVVSLGSRNCILHAQIHKLMFFACAK